MTVRQNIAYGLKGVNKAQRESRVEEMLATFHLEGLEGRRPGQLSGVYQSGRVVRAGSPPKVVCTCGTPEVDTLMGESRVVRLEAKGPAPGLLRGERAAGSLRRQ